MIQTPSLRERYGYLPAPLVLILETVGEKAMEDLVRALGGRRISLGRPPGPHHPLSVAVGPQTARAIQKAFAENHVLYIDVPRMALAHCRAKHQNMIAMRAKGATIAQIAHAYAMTERGVYLALAQYPTPEQPSQQLILPL